MARMVCCVCPLASTCPNNLTHTHPNSLDPTHTLYGMVLFVLVIWRSTDTGATWSEIGPPGDRYWYAADMSSDGMTVVAAVWRENLWATTDGGLTWSDITPSNVPYRGWHAIACSLDCSAVRVAVYSGNLWSGYLSSAGG
jgi:hypothetical protein